MEDSGPEFWDLVDVDGKSTGEQFVRGSGPLPEDRFHVVSATCVARQDGTVLLQQRALGREFGLKWEFPGGSALAGESSEQAAIRELREESGIDVREDQLESLGRYVEGSALVDLYLAQVPQGALVTIDPNEVNDFEWVTLDEVERRLNTGCMAEPWTGRLDFFSSSLAQGLNRKSP